MDDPLVQEIMKDVAIKEVRFKSKIWRVCMEDGVYATIGETMYIDEADWKAYIRDKRTTRLRSLIIHESTHASRQLQIGMSLWMFYYFTSTTFRWEEEKIAYEAEWRVEIADGKRYTGADFHFFAKNMSGPMYHGMTTYDEAYEFMKRTNIKLQEEYKK
jgi:hypothetical protein